jgi:hypothetical protein
VNNDKITGGGHAGPDHDNPDDSLGAVEGETPSDPQRGNPQGTGVDDQGRPNNPAKTGQDRIGANLDETEG